MSGYVGQYSPLSMDTDLMGAEFAPFLRASMLCIDIGDAVDAVINRAYASEENQRLQVEPFHDLPEGYLSSPAILGDKSGSSPREQRGEGVAKRVKELLEAIGTQDGEQAEPEDGGRILTSPGTRLTEEAARAWTALLSSMLALSPDQRPTIKEVCDRLDNDVGLGGYWTGRKLYFNKHSSSSFPSSLFYELGELPERNSVLDQKRDDIRLPTLKIYTTLSSSVPVAAADSALDRLEDYAQAVPDYLPASSELELPPAPAPPAPPAPPEHQPRRPTPESSTNELDPPTEWELSPGMDVARISTSFKRLHAERLALTALLREHTPVQSPSDVDGLRPRLRGLSSSSGCSVRQRARDEIGAHQQPRERQRRPEPGEGPDVEEPSRPALELAVAQSAELFYYTRELLDRLVVTADELAKARQSGGGEDEGKQSEVQRLLRTASSAWCSAVPAGGEPNGCAKGAGRKASVSCRW
ncbi:hypothetical protein CALVIDRAFT_531140 [Calocera viscosa TUFC12733]|uniref:Uncharacterized protein n=1 Tax=Calocera viscosa (strain TUFC12733) TaxID=1330018 RepID=A0A167GVR2_CALVF|nr:hypothetical protein CALVIDRAFT_531140 [Calocera viscosa TUFC12733]